jgi:sulfur carrier protein ThiS
MLRWALLAASFLILGDADIPFVTRLKPPAPNQPVVFPPDQNLPLLPDFGQNPSAAASKDDSKPAPKPAKKNAPLQPESRLEIVRFVSGEFAKAIKPLPGGKKGFHLTAGKPLDEQGLRRAVSIGGPAVNSGDSVQITHIEFRDKQLVFDLNGGGHQKTRWRDHIQIGMGTNGPTPPITNQQSANAAPGYQGTGATVYLDFDKPLPDMTPDELKGMLAAILDFSKQRSAAVQWVQSLPPEMQAAIKDKHVVAGMSQEMVVAALGKPDRKVRERDGEGIEKEDWIYGQPPDKMTFVTFQGDKVVRVREFNN